MKAGRGGRGKKGGYQKNPVLKRKLESMNSAYVNKDFEKVIKLAEEIKQIDKDEIRVYKVLCDIYEGQSP